MILTDAEKQDFLERMQSLLDIDVITKDVRDMIFSICLAACGNALNAERDGLKNEK